MIKKVFYIGIILLMIFSLVGCHQKDDTKGNTAVKVDTVNGDFALTTEEQILLKGDDIDLSLYKIAAKATLGTYVQNKGKDNYAVEAWSIIGIILIAGEVKIDAALDKDCLNNAVDEAKTAIDEVVPREENMDEILKHFDLTDPKIFFDETLFSDNMYEGVDSIIITFKKTSTYPILELQDFNLTNAKRFAYGQATPHDGPSGWIEFDDGHQKGQIMLMEGGKEKILEAIRHLEKFEFVKSVRPLHYYVTLF